MTHVARIAIDLPFEGPVTDQIRSALADLADIMLVQAEDGLYTLGSPDAAEGGDFLVAFEAGQTATVNIA